MVPLMALFPCSWLGDNKLTGNIPEMGALKELETLYVIYKLLSLFIHYYFPILNNPCIFLLQCVDLFSFVLVKASGEQPAWRTNPWIIRQTSETTWDVSIWQLNNSSFTFLFMVLYANLLLVYRYLQNNKLDDDVPDTLQAKKIKIQ